MSHLLASVTFVLLCNHLIDTFYHNLMHWVQVLEAAEMVTRVEWSHFPFDKVLTAVAVCNKLRPWQLGLTCDNVAEFMYDFVVNCALCYFGSSSSPLLSLVTSTSEISHQPVHTYTTYIWHVPFISAPVTDPLGQPGGTKRPEAVGRGRGVDHKEDDTSSKTSPVAHEWINGVSIGPGCHFCF